MGVFSPEWLRCALVQPAGQVQFNEVVEKVPKVPEKVWEALAQQGSGEDLVRSQVGFNKVPKKVPVKVWEAWCRARSGSTGFAVI